MRRVRLLWHIYPYYLVIIILALVALTWYISHSVRQFYLDNTRSELESIARLVERQVHGYLPERREGEVQRLCVELGTLSGARITVVLPSGTVVGDSDEAPQRMENHADRPEIADALAGITRDVIRYSDTIKQRFMYVAVPVQEDERILGVVRASRSLTAIDESMGWMYTRIVIGGIVVAVVAALVSLLVSRRISRPLDEMKEGVEHFARNELSYRLPVHELKEIAGLAEVMNEMAARLEERIEAVEHQRNEQEAVFSSMVEGLLAVDTEERVIKINRAASGLLGIDIEKSNGRTIQEVVRNPDLQKFVARALASSEKVEGDIVLYSDTTERFLQAHGTPLFNTGNRRLGAVVVLNDVTRIRRLENVRRDFVANVSHELKTPITSIKGFVETLLEGAIHVPGDAEHFLGIIAKQVERMNSIIEDLLLISRTERDVEKDAVRLERGNVKEILEESIQLCEVKSGRKNITLALSCPDALTARINPALIEQAVVNLIDNAIKYSDEGSSVEITARHGEGEVLIEVRDRGAGIDKEHLPRLFERFYRVDKARSRKLGGTGLGLAIVKHICQAHGGGITVESTPGEGSTFTIHLPDGA
jgi:two-component system phosphate regulon sensor histidine kinase PhoR